VTFSAGSAWRRLGRGLLVAGLAGMMVFDIVVIWITPDGVTGTAESVMQTLRGLGGAGPAAFAVPQAFVAVSGGLPASLVGFAAGAAYGLVPGFALAAVSTMVGAVLAFCLSCCMFRSASERLASRRPRLHDLDALIARDGWKLVCLLRISPIVPFSVTSYLLGLSSIDLGNYMLGTLGSLPALFGYVFLGTLADADLSACIGGASLLHWLLLGIGAAATLVLTFRIGKIAAKLGLIPQPSGASSVGLAVHPLNKRDIWKGADSGAAWRAECHPQPRECLSTCRIHHLESGRREKGWYHIFQSGQ
jgi:uncharacterized membrane protein YdjX (TVP38/TMEM64 family)